jgi:hypothetical protein
MPLQSGERTLLSGQGGDGVTGVREAFAECGPVTGASTNDNRNWLCLRHEALLC